MASLSQPYWLAHLLFLAGLLFAFAAKKGIAINVFIGIAILSTAEAIITWLQYLFLIPAKNGRDP